MATRYEKLLIYNYETNQIGWIPWLYKEHQYTTGWASITPNEPYKPPKSNLSFLAKNDNKWCVVGTAALYRKLCYSVDSASWTPPYMYYDSDDSRVYVGTSDKGATTSQGIIRISGNVVRELYIPGGSDFTSETSTFSSEKTDYGYTGYRTGNYTWTCSAVVDGPTSVTILRDLYTLFNTYATFYVLRAGKYGYNGCLPIAVKRNTYALGYDDRLFCSVIWPATDQGFTLGRNVCGPQVGYNFTEVNPTYACGPSSIYNIECGSYEAYQSGRNYTALTRYINDFHNGETPEDLGELSPSDLAGDNIYTPGGDTTDPHNPYPSGNSPYTVDPLDSGEETDSPNTDGTWELPFDTVSLDHARVDSSQAGVYRLVGLTKTQLQAMADYMFSDTSVTEAWENLMKLIYGNVVDTIIGIQEFPMDVSDSVGTDIFCFIGRDISTGMFAGKALSSEYRSLDFGTIEVPRYSGTFYDFEPYTTLTLYIPYIGYIDMKPTEVVGSTLYINGWVHLSTGEVTINVRSSRTGVLGSYSGNIGRSIPVSSADSTRLYAAIIETAAGIGGYASFGASASAMGGIEHADPHNMNVARGQYAQAVKAYGSAKRGVRGAQANMLEKQAAYEQAKEEFSSAKTAERQEVQAAERAEREFNEAGLEAYSNAIDAVTSGFEVVRGTHMTPGAGRTAPQVCFLRIEVPHQNVSKNQKLLGYPCNSAEVLNSDKLHGYTELRMIDLQIPGISLTELQELESILKGGFYLP